MATTQKRVKETKLNLKRQTATPAADERIVKRLRLEQYSAAAETTPPDEKQAEASTSKTESKPRCTLAHQSPKKRIELGVAQKKEKYIYGNYSQYYGYRNQGKDLQDIRLDVFEEQREIFRNKEVLDIGCNNGYITMHVAKKLSVKHIIGIDIDHSLINQAIKQLVRQKKSLPPNNEAAHAHTYPYNVRFVHGNYVLSDDVLLEIESAQFDLILCLSITKWIHLNFGDAGLKQAFRRMYLQLRPGGKLILEAQSFDNYGRRKKMTDTIFANYKAMQFFPKQFTDYLLSADVGFKSTDLMGIPEHCAAGFKRPIQVFSK